MYLGSAALAALLSASFAAAQQQTSAVQANMAYNLNNETLVQGTVVSYTAASSVAPIGPHATIQTSSGTIDVHLGNAELMKINDMFLESGDSVKVVGVMENFGNGNVFLVRVLQKGSQTLTLRNDKGIPLAAKRAGAAKARSPFGGAQ
jgi:DNA/RNA endonuclease YhcR with UshA esterase domain